MSNMSGLQVGHKLPWHKSSFDMTSSRSRQDPAKIKTWAILRWSSHLRLSNPSCGGKSSLSLLLWARVGAVVAGVGKKEHLLCEFRWMMTFAQIDSWKSRSLPAFLLCSQKYFCALQTFGTYFWARVFRPFFLLLLLLGFFFFFPHLFLLVGG